MKRSFSLLFACLFLICAMTACGAHTHKESESWSADADSHWKVCDECGEELRSGEHELDEEGRCGTCNSHITVFEDSVRVVICDDEGEIISIERYDFEGNPWSKAWEEREYDENDCLLEEQYYVNGMLSQEIKYTVVNGESIPTQYSEREDDGTMRTHVYDIHGNELAVTKYDAEGNVQWQTNSTYLQTSGGEWYEASYTEVNSDGQKIVMTYTEYGDTTSEITYDAEGNVLADYANEYTYDENGIITSEKAYENGVLCSETIYKVLNGEETYVETEISYNEDGSYCTSVYSESGELLSMTSFDADGNVIE